MQLYDRLAGKEESNFQPRSSNDMVAATAHRVVPRPKHRTQCPGSAQFYTTNAAQTTRYPPHSLGSDGALKSHLPSNKQSTQQAAEHTPIGLHHPQWRSVDWRLVLKRQATTIFTMAPKNNYLVLNNCVVEGTDPLRLVPVRSP